MSATADYVSFFSHVANFAPMALLSLFLLGIFRLVPIVMFAPFFGQLIPAGVKMGLTMAITVIMLPHMILTTKTMVDFNYLFVAYCIKEFFVGMILAFMVSIPFYIAQSSGSLIDFLRGSSALQVTDPSTKEQTSPIGILYNYMLIVIFYQINGPILFFDSVLQSYTMVPADGFINPLFFTSQQPFWHVVMALLTKLTALSIQLAAPSLLAILMTEVFLGIANRLAPQVQIVFIGMSLKSLIGLAILCTAWIFIMQQLTKQTLLWLKDLDKILYSIPT